MVLKEKEYIRKINSYSEQVWKPLLDLIPEIEATQKFGEVKDSEEFEEGVFTFPHMSESPIVLKFHEMVYNIPIIIDFDWSSWDEGRKIASDNQFDFDTIDIPTKCKLITATVRNDRFCDGVLISVFDSGIMLKILRSIQNQLIFISKS